MQLSSVTESQAIRTLAGKNTRVIIRYINTDGRLVDLTYDWSYSFDIEKFKKLAYWAAVNLVELRIIPNA